MGRGRPPPALELDRRGCPCHTARPGRGRPAAPAHSARARADKLLGDPDGLDGLGEDEEVGGGLQAHRQRVQVRHLVTGERVNGTLRAF